MGMDVVGRSPKSPEGEYYRADIWGWRVLQYLMAKCGTDLLGPTLVQDMSTNDGCGPTSQQTCDELADRIESYINENETHIKSEGLSVDLGMYVDKEGNPIKDNSGGQGKPEHSIDYESLREWVTFLRSCGGFEVW